MRFGSEYVLIPFCWLHEHLYLTASDISRGLSKDIVANVKNEHSHTVERELQIENDSWSNLDINCHNVWQLNPQNVSSSCFM